MRRILIFALLISCTVTAQIRDRNDIEFIPFVGMASSGYYGSKEVQDNKSLFAPVFGINADFYMNSRWSVKMGIEYQTMGTRGYTSRVAADPISHNFYEYHYAKEKLNFFSFPIHANLHFGKTRNWNINLGPTISFLTSGSLDGEKININNLRKEQAGMGLGFGYRFHINENFSIAIDYQEYISFTSNIFRGFGHKKSFIGNISGNLNVRAVFKLKSNAPSEEPISI
ncbi:MAG TPA: outer membrane beta-barrel protein [Flavobacterium sp.]|nr:outer membrane beta-barrel protein [Flavobacterium sp.]